jgi:hypothetical protein
MGSELVSSDPGILGKNGAGTRSRTRDLLITNQLLYQLSYAGYWDCGQVARSRKSTLSSPCLSTIAPAPLPGGKPMST